MYKKTKSIISLLLMLSMLTWILPVNSSAASSISSPTVNSYMNFSDFFNKLTVFINEKIGGQISNQALSNYLQDENFAKAIAQREFIRKAGANTIDNFIVVPEKKEFIMWLFNNTEAMNLFLESGEPDTEYSKVFEVWFEIWSKDSASHSGYELKLAIASAMKFGDGVAKWYTSRTLVTPYERYEYYKIREAEGRFPISMKTRSIWELRNTINAPVSNADLDYIREVIHKDRYNATNQRVNIWYPPYTATSPYKDANGNNYSVFSSSGDQFFGPNATIKEVHEIGGVCGTNSKLGSITVNSFGIAGYNIGQPGHAAHIYYSPNSYGKWDIGYDVFGWGESGIGEATNIPYTNYKSVYNRVPYWFVYEEARADQASLRKSFQLKWIADALNDYNAAQSVRKIALETNRWNVDVWRDYINAMKKLWNNALEETKIPSSNITVTATSENSSGEGASNVIDGDINSIWHSRYSGKREVLPQAITLNFDKEYEITKFVYVPRVSGGNGKITEYKIYTSLDGVNYEVVSSGNWSTSNDDKVVEFNTPINAKYIKLEALKGVGDFASAAELKAYGVFNNKPITQGQWEELAYEIMNKFDSQPAVMFDLIKLIQDNLINKDTPREKHQKYILDINRLIDKASELSWKQKQIVDNIKKNIFTSEISLADFNFDGNNAGRLVGSKTDLEYSLDGGKSWKGVTEENMLLNKEEIASITPENGIKVRVKGTNDHIIIPISKAPALPTIYANDDINKLFNMNENIFYSIDNGDNWVKYENNEKLPNLSGDVDLMVRIPAQGKTVVSETKTFKFTSKLDTTIILPSDIVGVKGDEDGRNPISNAYDGNIYTFWHSNYGADRKPLPQSITFELKEESKLYKLEYTPRQDNNSNGRITEYNIYTSVDGENFTKVSNGKWDDDFKTKTALVNALDAKYVRLEAVKAGGNFVSAAEIRLFKTEDLIPYVSFNLDGEDSGRLMGANTHMEYSIDEGQNWKDINEVNMMLPSEELKYINPNTVIKVRFKNADKVAEIRFAACKKTPNVEGNDVENTITGLDNTMEYSTDGGTSWTRYNGTFNVDLRANVRLHVRTSASGTTLPGCDVMLDYTSEVANNFRQGVVYKIINKATGKSIDVASGSGEDDAEVILYRYGGGGNQTVYMVPVGENEYKIVMRHSGKVLSPQKLSSENGAVLAQTTYNGANNQKWRLVNLGNDDYQLINVGTGLAVTLNDQGKIVNSKLVYSNKQVWTISYVYDEVTPKVDFSFDGENPGKLMGADRTMEYTIDDGATWKSITETNMVLPKEDLGSVQDKYGIKVRVKGNPGITKININSKPVLSDIKLNDNLNIIEGANSSMEYSVDNGLTWIKYTKDNEPKFINDEFILIRVAGAGLTPPSENKGLRFTSKITTPIHKEFNPLDYISIKNHRIEIIKNNTDINKKGIYSLEYKLIDNNGNETIITKEVEVVSEACYLSDISYKSGNVGSGGVKKDTNLNSTINNGVITLNSNMGKKPFKKGITAHANSEIVYDVTDKGYTNFESYIGIDDTAYNTSASVIFKVYVDGEVKYESGVMNAKTPYKFINVNIAGGKEVKLVVNSNGSMDYDHSVWAEAKFISRNSAPMISASDVAYEKGDNINFDEILSKVIATDVEDGDLSSKVTYTTNYKKGSTGSFNIVYNVEDSEGNKSEKSVKLIVSNGEKYLSDVEWQSAKIGWGSIGKDLSINGTPIRLWDGSKEITYNKGIGTHAYSEIVYNLENENYAFFTSYVGADRNNKGSIEFKVYVDGKLVESTEVMNRDTAQKFIKVNVVGAKQLKLVVTEGGNGKGSDWAVWADAKLFMVNGNTYAIDVDKLKEAMSKAEALNKENYEENSWKLVEEKLIAAKAILNNKNLEQAEVDKACKEITEAMESLKTYVNATDVEWVKAYSQQGAVKKNTAFSGSPLKLWDGTKEVIYENGIGTHSNSEIIYDLTNKNYKNFTSIIGLDRTGAARSAVQFKVLVDDKEVFASDIMKRGSLQKAIKINIEGAKKLTLILNDGGNGRGNDVGDWVNPKFEF